MSFIKISFLTYERQQKIFQHETSMKVFVMRIRLSYMCLEKSNKCPESIALLKNIIKLRIHMKSAWHMLRNVISNMCF